MLGIASEIFAPASHQWQELNAPTHRLTVCTSACKVVLPVYASKYGYKLANYEAPAL